MTLAGSGVSIVADGPRALQPLDDVLSEYIGDQTHLPMGNKTSAVRRNNAARFLAAMLEGIKSQIDHVGRFGMAIDSPHRAFFVKLVEHFRSPYLIRLVSPADQNTRKSSNRTPRSGRNT